jgi:hypothetical protein
MSGFEQVRCSVPANWSNNFSQCLYDWQGLEGAALALLAAILGVKFLQRQITQAQTHRADEIARRHNAARLTLPLTLAAVSQLTQKIADEAAASFESLGPDDAKAIESVVKEPEQTKFAPVSLPTEVLGSFENFVASLNRAPDIRHVAELVASIQILVARFNDFDLEQAGAQHSLISLLLDAAKVRLLTDEIYNYARFVDDSSFGIVGVITVAAAWDKIHGKAQGLLFSRQSPDAFFPSLKEKVERYKERNVSPWNEKFRD